jgi:hypothetical protein
MNGNHYTSLNTLDNTQLTNYWRYMLIVGVYYLTPSIQNIYYKPGDQCHYNLKCSHQFGNIHSFNNIVSNIFYIIFGFIYLVIVKKKTIYTNGIAPSGTLHCKSLYYSLGICLIFEGISSSIYHLCPSRINLQFNTTFMIICILLLSLTIYNKRHQRRILEPFKFYLLVVFVLTLNILSLGTHETAIQRWFWGAIFMFISYLMIFGSIYVYYGHEYDLNMDSIKILIQKIKTIKNTEMDYPRFILLIIINTFTLGSCIYAAFSKPDFTGWILIVSIINMVIYFIYYLVLKYFNGETLYYSIKISLILNTLCSIASLYFYLKSPTNIFVSIDKSNELNTHCVLFNYFDNRDIWHILSAISIFTFMNIILFIDEDLYNSVSEMVGVF